MCAIWKHMAKPGNMARSVYLKNANGNMRLTITIIFGAVLGFFLGISVPTSNMLHFPGSIITYIKDNSGLATQALLDHALSPPPHSCNSTSKIYVPTNPRGAEGLPPNIIVPESDLYPRRLWGNPSEDLQIRQKYLVTFTVGCKQKSNIDAAIKKFSENFTIMLFHYDGRASEWDEFDWSKKAIHVSARKQTKWWFAKRFLHPDIVASYDYIFIWDEDLGVDHFNAEEYIKLVKKHGLEISQPGLEPHKGLTWQITKRRRDREVHREAEEKPGRCSDPCLPPCAAFVEIMATVFSREAWRCTWHMIQNDLVHGWGLDFALRRCVEVLLLVLRGYCFFHAACSRLHCSCFFPDSLSSWLMRELESWILSGSFIKGFLRSETRASQRMENHRGKECGIGAEKSGESSKIGWQMQRRHTSKRWRPLRRIQRLFRSVDFFLSRLTFGDIT